jgi:hypothetical protein
LLSADVTDGGLPDLGTSEGQAEIDAAIEDAELVIVDNLAAISTVAGPVACKFGEIFFRKSMGLITALARLDFRRSVARSAACPS